LRTLAEISLVAATLVWGVTFVVIKESLRDTSTLVFLAVRFTLASVFLASGMAALRRKFEWSGPALKAGLLGGVFLALGHLLQTAGLRYTSAPKSAFLTGLYIVVVPLAASAVYRSRPGVNEILGTLIATLGMAFMTFDGLGSALKFEMGKGDLMTVGCAIAFAGQLIVLADPRARANPDSLTLIQLLVTAGAALGTFWWVEEPYFRLSPRLGWWLVWTSLLATTVAIGVQTWAQQHTTATRAALLFATEPVFAWLASVWMTGEGLAVNAAWGAALILAGVLVVELAPGRGRVV